MKSPSAFIGVARYEYLMQLRRPGLWITFFILTILLLLPVLGANTWHTYSHERMTITAFADVASLLMILFPVAVGVLLADRLPRDRSTRVAELLDTLPPGAGTRLWGKYVGSTCATLTPVILSYGVGIAYLLTLRPGAIAAVELAILPLLAVVLPGMLFVAAYSVACPAVIWVPLYQFLFVGYWFWGNLLALPTLPTVNGSLLTANGDYMLVGFFGGDGTNVHHATALQGAQSLSLLLTLGGLALLAAWRYQRWQKAHQ